MKPLKLIRIIIAIIFFIFLSLAFIAIPSISPSNKMINFFTFFQFIPSLLQFTITFTAIGFIIIFLLTLFIGRVYCSTICPLGVLQDIIARLGIWFKKVKIYRYAPPMNWLRYGVFVIIFISIFITGTLLVGAFDPYSNFGRIFSGIVRPVFVWANDNLSRILASVITIYPIGLKNYSLINWIYPLIVLIVVGVLSLYKGRLFCNTICPVGTLLGFISRYSLYKININKYTCTKCGKCVTKCKAQCIDIRSQKVDFDRCVGCMNCISICAESSINFTTNDVIKAKIDAPEMHDPDRRNFIGLITGSVIGSSILSAIEVRANVDKNSINAIEIKKKYTISPPGSISFDHFTSRCTVCHLCISQCPTHVLKPSFLEYGFTGMLMPYLNYSESFCNYECTQCSQVCPTGAIMPLSVESKKILQIGQVIFVKDNCIVALEETSCGACAEHCPTAAVHMVPYKGDLRIPETNHEICIGCGACEYACPAKPNKAIYVDGNPIHEIAKKTTEDKIKDEVPDKFPF